MASGSGGDQRAPQTSQLPRKLASAVPFDLRRIASATVVPTEREFVRPVGGGSWLVLAVGSCPTQPPTGPNLCLLPMCNVCRKYDVTALSTVGSGRQKLLMAPPGQLLCSGNVMG